MEIKFTSSNNIYIIQHGYSQDLRGDFSKIYNHDAFKEAGLESDFKECFFTRSRLDVIRGMHFQLPPADHCKMVTVLKGLILDVIVDLRNTEKKLDVFTMMLHSKSNKSLYIGKGMAHGFLVLSDDAVVQYMTTSVYSPEHDSGVRWDSFGFDWGISPEKAIVSERDKSFIGALQFDTSQFKKN